MNDATVTVAAGSLRNVAADVVTFPHRWTDGGVGVEAAFTGAHLLHLAAAGCVLNDLYREALEQGLRLHGVRVVATGGFDTTVWHSTGISYHVELDCDAGPDAVAALLSRVDAVAEIPRVLRAGAPVVRRP